VTKSEPVREYAAYLFLKWFTEAETNLAFCANTGYMPVQRDAFDAIIEGNFPEIENPMIEKTLLIVAEMTQSYRFYFPPVFDGFDSLQTRYTDRLRRAAQDGRNEYLRLLGTQEETDAFETVSSNAMENFITQFNP
jgi:multiple sugar transport system substrate-binding protein